MAPQPVELKRRFDHSDDVESAAGFGCDHSLNQKLDCDAVHDSAASSFFVPSHQRTRDDVLIAATES